MISWEHAAVIADVGVAVGTLFLAVVTYRMAQETQRSVAVSNRLAEDAENEIEISRQLAEKAERQIEATNRQAAVAEETLNASIQPLIADVPYQATTNSLSQAQSVKDPGLIRIQGGRQQDGKMSVLLSIPIRNVGNGPAIIQQALLTSRGDVERADERQGPSLINKQGTSSISFVVIAPNSQTTFDQLCSQLDEFTVVVRYTNIYGTSCRVSTLDIKEASERFYRVETLRFAKFSEGA